MGKQPYIPLYIGDWLKDTGDLSLEAEGALLKLVFKLWDAPVRGQLSISFSKLALLFKKDEQKAAEIVRELQELETLDIELLPDRKVKFESRRMLKKAALSKTYSDNGKKGGRGKKANEKPIKSQSKAKPKPNADNDIDNDIEVGNENKGGVGENLVEILPFTSENFKHIWRAWKKYRTEIKKPYQTFSAKQATLDRLSKHPEEIAIAMLKTAMSNEWKDVYEFKDNGKKSNSDNPSPAALATDTLRILAQRKNRNNGGGDQVQHPPGGPAE